MKKRAASLSLALLVLVAAAAFEVATSPYAPTTAPVDAQGTRAPVRVTAPYRVAVGTSAAPLTSSGNVNGGVVIRAICPGQIIYIGVAGVTTSNGFPLSDGETLTLEVRDANQIYAIASAAAQSVAVLPFSRY